LKKLSTSERAGWLQLFFLTGYGQLS